MLHGDNDTEVAVAIVALAAAAVVSQEEQSNNRDKRKGRDWEGPLCSKRKTQGTYYTTVPNLIAEEEADDLPSNRPGTFRNFFRMNRNQFNIILEYITPIIQKQNTTYRDSISAEQRLMVTLRYLATGSSLTELSYNWRISVACLSNIIHETCDAIVKTMQGIYLKTPTSQEEWQKIVDNMETHWNFPNAIGALDGKHVTMTKPWRAGSQYHNYKGTESIVLMALCDHNYHFTFVDVGAQGRVSDGGVFRNCSLSRALDDNTLNLPPPRSPPGWIGAPLPHVVLADEAFPLKEYLMRPYSRRQLTNERKIFNYRLSRGRRLIENAFGILSATWRILLRRIDLQPEKVMKLTVACCILHNLLRATRPSPQGGAPSEPSELEIIEQEQQLNNIEHVPLRPSREATATRDNFCTYVNTVGSVPWQHRMVFGDNE